VTREKLLEFPTCRIEHEGGTIEPKK